MRHDRQLLVVAFETDDRVGLRGLPAHQKLDHVAAVRSAIDVVAEEHVTRRPLARMGLAGPQQAPQLVQAAVDVADREGQG